MRVDHRRRPNTPAINPHHALASRIDGFVLSGAHTDGIKQSNVGALV